MVPAFVLVLKMGQKTAVATSLAAIGFTAGFTNFKNHANGIIVWRVAIPGGIAGTVIGWFAADLLRKFQDVTLARMRVRNSDGVRDCTARARRRVSRSVSNHRKISQP